MIFALQQRRVQQKKFPTSYHLLRKGLRISLSQSLGKHLVLDVVVSCPLQHKHLLEAAQTAGFTCNDKAEQIKIKYYQEKVEREGFIYLPAVFESFGGFSCDLPVFLFKLTKGLSLRLNELKPITSKYLYENLFCALMKSTARSISSRFPDF